MPPNVEAELQQEGEWNNRLLHPVSSQNLESDSILEDEEDEFSWMDELEEMDAQQCQAPTQEPVQTSSNQTAFNAIDETSPDFNPFHRNTPAHITQKYINAQLEHSKPQTVKRSDNQDWSAIDEMIITFELDISLHSKIWSCIRKDSRYWAKVNWKLASSNTKALQLLYNQHQQLNLRLIVH